MFAMRHFYAYRFWGLHEAKNLQALLGIVQESTAKGKKAQWERDRSSYRQGDSKAPYVNLSSHEDVELNPRILSRKERRKLEFGEPTGVGRRKIDDNDGVSIKENEAAKVTSQEMIRRALLNRIGSSGNSHLDSHGANGGGNDTDQSSRNAVVEGNKIERELFVVPVSGSRGLHLKDVGVVYILTPPKTMDEYLHMAGRTGREGKAGKVVTLANLDEIKRLQSWQTALGIQYDVKYTR